MGRGAGAGGGVEESESGRRGGRVPLGTRLLYGSGSVAFGVKDNGFAYFLLIYYNQVLGLPSTAVGAALNSPSFA